MIVDKITAKLALTDGTNITFDKTNMKSMQSLSQSTSDASTIYYGCMPSTGNIEIIDTNGTIRSYIEQGLIDTSKVELDIYINDNIIRHHVSTDSDYVEEDKSFNISLGDLLDLWSEINFTGYYYPEHSESAYEMLSNIFISYGYSQSEIDDMLSDVTINDKLQVVSIKNYLNSINIEYPYLPQSTFREMIDKFCVLGQLNCYIDITGKPKFINARPVVQSINDTIVIPRNKQYTSFSKSVLLKNKFDAIEINKYDVSNQLLSNEIVYSTNIPLTNSNVYSEEDSDIEFLVRQYRTATQDRIMTSYVYLNETYFQYDILIPQFSNFNLKKVLSVYTGTDSNNDSNIKYIVNGMKKTNVPSDEENSSEDEDIVYSSANVTITSYSSSIGDLVDGSASGYIEESSISDNFSEETNINESIDRDGTIEINNEYVIIISETGFGWTGSVTASASQENKSNINTATFTRNENGDFLFNDLIFIVGEKTQKLQGYIDTSRTGSPTTIPVTGHTTEIVADSIEISLYGNVKEISFENVSINSDNINIAKNPINITTNELVSNKTTIDGVEIVDIIKNNILNDYENGVQNGIIQLAYSDYYYNDGTKAVSTKNGEIITVGSIVKMENDNKLWKVTGVNIEKSGYPKYSEIQVMQLLTFIIDFMPIEIPNYENTRFTNVIFNEKYVLSSDSNVLVSDDLLTFQDVTPSTTSELSISCIKYIDDKLFLLRDGNFPIFSQDYGTSWNENDAYIDYMFDMRDISYGNGTYVICGYAKDQYSQRNIAYSNDGVSWQTKNIGGNYIYLGNIVFGNNKFITLDTTTGTNIVYYSYDGINWQSSQLPYTVNCRNISYGNNCFVITASYGNYILYSSDGENWNRLLLSDMGDTVDGPCVGLNFINNSFVFQHGDYIYQSYNGIDWTSFPLPMDNYVGANSPITYDNVSYMFAPYLENGRIYRFSRKLGQATLN